MTKKQTATTFLHQVSSGDVREAFKKYVHPDFIHHNVYFNGDRASLKKAMEENAREFPDKTYEVLRTLEDEDLVTVHGKITLGDKLYGVIHIFRFEDDQIIEAWEASQEELDDSPNENGLF